MKNKFHQLYLLLPHKDCEKCGNPDCATFARKLVLGEQSIGDCPFIEQEKVSKIKDILNSGIQIGVESRYVSRSEANYIKPCADQKGSVMADVYLAKDSGSNSLRYGFYDPYVMCRLLKESKDFVNVKCSVELGIGKFEHEGKVVLINRKGKLTIRKAKDKKRLEKTVKKIQDLLSGAVICRHGTATLNCGRCRG